MPKDWIILDIETQAYTWEEVKHLAPKKLTNETPPDSLTKATPPSFDQYKKAETRERKLAEWQQEHDLKVAQYPVTLMEEREKWLDWAALDPSRSFLSGYTVSTSDGKEVIKMSTQEEEPEVLAKLIKTLNNCEWDPENVNSKSRTVYTWNGHNFDLPYLTYRAWILGRKHENFPQFHYMQPGKKWIKDHYIDMMEVFTQFRWMKSGNDKMYPSATLNQFCKIFGYGELKPHDPSKWAKMTEEERMEYLQFELGAHRFVAETLNLI